MVPKAPGQEMATIFLLKIYSRTLATEFHRVAESDLWTLYERAALADARKPR